MIEIRYFAWLRTRVGRASEQVEPPEEVATVGALMQWLAGRHAGFAQALAASGMIRAAVNHDHAGPEQPIRPGDEVAFFPPVTGG